MLGSLGFLKKNRAVGKEKDHPVGFKPVVSFFLLSGYHVQNWVLFSATNSSNYLVMTKTRINLSPLSKPSSALPIIASSQSFTSLQRMA